MDKMSATKILEELPKLTSEERHTLFVCLNELEAADIEEAPEMLAAIDAGIRSLEQHGGSRLKWCRVDWNQNGAQRSLRTAGRG